MKFLQERAKLWKVRIFRVSNIYHFLKQMSLVKVLKLTLTHCMFHINNIKVIVNLFSFEKKVTHKKPLSKGLIFCY